MIDSDLDRLMAVMEAAFDPHWREAWTRRQVEDSLLLPSTYMLLGGHDGHDPGEGQPAAGFVLARHLADEDELLLLAVRPEARGGGIGRTLLARFEGEARERGATRVFLEMRSNNTAETLYRSCGYDPIGRRPRYYRTAAGQELDAITYAKTLV